MLRVRPRVALAALALSVISVSALAACGASGGSLAAPIRTTTDASQGEGPAVTPSRTPGPKPKPTITRTPPPVPIKPITMPVQTGPGPDGSIKTTGNESVALTFDDGPDPTHTPQILNLLKTNGVKATFCLVGKRVKAYPALVRRIHAEGHTLCNHTWAHTKDFGKQSKEVILADLQDTNTAIRRVVPKAPIKYFRAPGGYFNPMLVGLAGSLGMHSLYWALDTRDWEFSTYGHGQTMVDHIVATVQTQTRRGSIILSHDYMKPDTITAYRTLLPWLKANATLIPMPVA